MMVKAYNYLFLLVGTETFSSVVWPTRVQRVILFYFRYIVMLFDLLGISSCQQHVASIKSLSLVLHSTFREYMFYHDDSLAR